MMNELVEGVLTIRTGLTEINLTGFVIERGAVDGDALTVGFHRDLLNVRRELGERLRVRQNGASRTIQEADVPHGQHTERQR